MKLNLWKMCAASAGLLMASALAAPAANVTFRVNMSVQTAMGLFDPATDGVMVAGNFNGWSTTPPC